MTSHDRTASGSARRASAAVADMLGPVLAGAGFDLEDVAVSRAGTRSVVRVVVDRDGGLDLDGVADATRLVGGVLDADDEVVPGSYVLEVTSPGVDRPLTAPRHWTRAVGRLVAVTSRDAAPLTGRVAAADEEAALLHVDGREVSVGYAAVTRAVVQVEFTHAGEGA